MLSALNCCGQRSHHKPSLTDGSRRALNRRVEVKVLVNKGLQEGSQVAAVSPFLKGVYGGCSVPVIRIGHRAKPPCLLISSFLLSQA